MIRKLKEVQALNMVRASYETRVLVGERTVKKAATFTEKNGLRSLVDDDQSVLDAITKLIHRLYAEERRKAQGAEHHRPRSFDEALGRVVALNMHSMVDLEWDTVLVAEEYGVSLDYAFARLGAIPEIAEGYPGVEWGES